MFIIFKGFSLTKSKTDSGSSEAYIEVLKSKLLPYFLYAQWTSISHDYTRSLYAVRIKFPYNFIIPKYYYDRSNKIMKLLHKFSFEEPESMHNIGEMASNAKQTLNVLEGKLANSKWASGSHPNILDVYVYSYLALMANFNLPFNSLQVHVKQCPNIMKYIDSFSKQFLENDGCISLERENNYRNYEEAKNTDQGQTYYTREGEEERPRVIRKRYIISTLIATFSMLAYSIIKGIVNVSSLWFYKRHIRFG